MSVPAGPAGPSAPVAARGAPRRLRADAERNRAALLDAAREVFAEQGLEAPLEEIALRAGVGIGTLYRRFPTRAQLVAAALFDKVAQYAEAAEQALAIPDPWAGFVTYVERICDLQADDRGLSDLLSMALPADEDIERLRRLANDRMAELIERAKAAGRLRQEFASEDLLLLLIAHAAVAHVTREDAPSAGRRFVALMLDAFGPQDGPSALPVPPSRTQMRRAMVRLAGERGCGERGCGEHGLGTTRLTHDAAGNAADSEGPLAGPGPASRPADRSDGPG
jgi:AcrR family transcriptional regulator